MHVYIELYAGMKAEKLAQKCKMRKILSFLFIYECVGIIPFSLR